MKAAMSGSFAQEGMSPQWRCLSWTLPSEYRIAGANWEGVMLWFATGSESMASIPKVLLRIPTEPKNEYLLHIPLPLVDPFF